MPARLVLPHRGIAPSAYPWLARAAQLGDRREPSTTLLRQRESRRQRRVGRPPAARSPPRGRDEGTVRSRPDRTALLHSSAGDDSRSATDARRFRSRSLAGRPALVRDRQAGHGFWIHAATDRLTMAVG